MLWLDAGTRHQGTKTGRILLDGLSKFVNAYFSFGFHYQDVRNGKLSTQNLPGIPATANPFISCSALLTYGSFVSCMSNPYTARTIECVMALNEVLFSIMIDVRIKCPTHSLMICIQSSGSSRSLRRARRADCVWIGIYFSLAAGWKYWWNILRYCRHWGPYSCVPKSKDHPILFP